MLASGNLDAAVSIDTLLTTYERNGARRVVSGSDVGAENPLYYIASDEAIARKKAAVGTFVNRLADHVAWGHAKPEERAKAVSELLRIDYDVALTAERKRPAALRPIDDQLVRNNQNISDVFLAQGLITKPLDASQSFTTEFNGYLPK